MRDELEVDLYKSNVYWISIIIFNQIKKEECTAVDLQKTMEFFQPAGLYIQMGTRKTKVTFKPDG